MKTKTGLVALGLFTFVATSIVNCGGSSDDSNDSSSTAGKGGSSSSTAGRSSTAGSSSTIGGMSSDGTDSGTAGKTSTAGTGGSGTAGTSNTAGTANNQGGASDVPGAGGAGGAGGASDVPGAGGAVTNPPGCPASMPSGMCTQMNVVRGGCDYGDMVCRCQRGIGQMRTWQCAPVIGAGGAGPGGFGATCPAAAKSGETCTGGPGPCTGQNRCFCSAQNKVTCF